MKIEFENDKEKECLTYILTDWLIHNGDYDVLACEPACRNEDSPGCAWCIKKAINRYLDNNKIEFWYFGGEDWLMQHGVDKFLEEEIKRKCN